MTGGELQVGDTLDGSRVVAVWDVGAGWRAVQTADGSTAQVEAGAEVLLPVERDRQPGLGFEMV